jgi:chorismate synthase
MALRFMTAGESHGPSLVAVLDGLPAGLALDVDLIQADMARRQHGYGAGPRMKLETDQVTILSGVMAGLTTGAPLTLQVQNSDHARWKDKGITALTTPRPGHADLAGAVKYGYTDLRPSLERASARETAARVAAGAVCRAYLSQFGIRVNGYVAAIGEISANLDAIPLEARFDLSIQNEVNCPDAAAAEKMRERIRQVMTERDTLGGIIEVLAFGLPVGLGSFAQWDRKLDARLGAAILSVQAIKGVEIGPAFENSRLPGTKAHDPINLQDQNLVRSGLRSGGLEAGMTTGQPIWLRAAMKPIPTTLTSQPTVDLASGQASETRYERSDFCPVPRAVVVLEAMTCLVLADALIEKLGGDSLAEQQPRFASLRQARLSDLPMQGGEIHFW